MEIEKAYVILLETPRYDHEEVVCVCLNKGVAEVEVKALGKGYSQNPFRYQEVNLIN